MEGWVKLYRQLLDWEWADEPKTAWLFIVCLLRANHQDKRYRGKTVPRGSFTTTIETLSSQCGLSIKETRTRLFRLEKSQNLATKRQTNYSIISITNYEKFQVRDESGATERQTTGNETATIKEGKNVKNERKEEIYTSISGAKGLDPVWVSDKFNSILGDSLPSIRSLTPARKKKINALFKSALKTQDDWEEYFHRVLKSPFLLGNSGKWQANFDWLINQTNVTKVLEGNYDEKEKARWWE